LYISHPLTLHCTAAPAGNEGIAFFAALLSFISCIGAAAVVQRRQRGTAARCVPFFFFLSCLVSVAPLMPSVRTNQHFLFSCLVHL